MVPQIKAKEGQGIFLNASSYLYKSVSQSVCLSRFHEIQCDNTTIFNQSKRDET